MGEVELKPCPLCADPMQISGQLLRHVNQGDCLIGAQAWPSEWAERWNAALTGGVTQADVGVTEPSESLVRECYDRFMHGAEYPCSASAMREVINLAMLRVSQDGAKPV